VELGILTLAAFVATLAGTKIVLIRAQANAELDHPDGRSSHKIPTPHGGGLALTIVLIAAWGYWGIASSVFSAEITVLLVAMAGLAGLSRLDDISPLPAKVRLLAQALAVAATLAVMPFENGPIGFLPAPLEWTLVGLGWIWFINLYNFMDGIDGITGVETLAIGGGITLLALGAGLLEGAVGPFALIAATAVLGFLWWNWHPAKIFMGDVGSIPLGFALGWLLIHLAQAGYWAAALILPLYYLADATITLVRRLMRGEKVWQAHREHFYQKAHQGGWPHDKVALVIAAANGLLIGLAWTSTQGWSAVSLGGAILVVGALLMALSRAGKTT